MAREMTENIHSRLEEQIMFTERKMIVHTLPISIKTPDALFF